MIGEAKEVSSSLRTLTLINKAKINADELDIYYGGEKFPEEQVLEAAILRHKLTDIADKELLEIAWSRLEEGQNYKIPPLYCEFVLKITQSNIIAAQAHYVLAVSLEQLKDPAKIPLALEHFNSALKICESFENSDPQEYIRIKSNIFRNQGLYLLSQKQNKDADVLFQKSLELAKQSPKLIGFIPAMTAYHALALCKQGLYEEGFKQFEEAEKLYAAFPKDMLENSMDYASFNVHLGRIHIQRYEEIKELSLRKSDAEKAVAALEIGDRLRSQVNIDGDYGKDRKRDSFLLLERARTLLNNCLLEEKQNAALTEKGKSADPVNPTALRQSGSPLHQAVQKKSDDKPDENLNININTNNLNPNPN